MAIRRLTGGKHDIAALQQHEVPQRINESIFAARLTYFQVCDFSLYGLWALREALEGEMSWCTAGPLERTVPIAHAWILHAGEFLVQLDDDRGSLARGGSLWTGRNGFGKERWLFWTQRLEELSSDSQLSTHTRGLAKEAADRMERLIAKRR